MIYYDIGEYAILVHIICFPEKDIEYLQEFKKLVFSADMKVVYTVISKCKTLNPKYLVGEGKALEIADLVQANRASSVIFNHILTPSQERNLQRLFKCCVVDRTGIILNIFAKRAKTYESKLQVELAQLRHIATRLVCGWTHLERQKGGIGLRGGPGETQLETDRRLLRKRIRQINWRLQSIKKQREQGRHARSKANINTISLIGYTNAGKSTLFNNITSANVYTADQFFATLDMTLRRLYIANVGEVILADTIGFISHLPYNLVAAFQATLQEISHANLLLHVVDATNIRINENIKSVNSVLENIKKKEITTLIIMNKIDKLEYFEPRIDRNEENIPVRVWISAHTGHGIPLLLTAISEILAREMKQCTLLLPANSGKLRSNLYKLKVIQKEWNEPDGSIILNINIPIVDWKRLCKKEPYLNSFIV
ncbi:ribosome rescue GTPase HflX [Candidatus Ishikawella capsulata]|uniref:GTPase HflX n=1 Tax=Candidatus Ishikawaella capsulata Mpkobe TaxID=476281 RepID=C5WCI1_9ENTR|nr:ribosome rescue GTPase HflX [Candidatus Ishikawaella capsulata]BAH83037.1 predicted GTPase [Candidatus Ishikawaella capsulata Mpkobe]